MTLIDEMRSATGGEVTSAIPGHGSFFELDIMRKDGRKIAFWVYLSDWAILNCDKKVLSSDSSSSTKSTKLKKLSGSMVKYVNLIRCSEIHIGLSGNIEIQIRENEREYGKGAQMIRLYVDNVHIGDYTATE